MIFFFGLLKWQCTLVNFQFVNNNQKEAAVALLISDIAYFRTRKTIGNKKGRDIIIKGRINYQRYKILNMYSHNKRVSTFMRQS